RSGLHRLCLSLFDQIVLICSNDRHQCLNLVLSSFFFFFFCYHPKCVCSTEYPAQVEESRDLLLFFRTLRTYADRFDDRCRTFQHFQEKYPSIVSLPGGCRSEVMTLNHPELPGCVLFVHWSVEVSREGGVAPKINLLTKIPERALQLFPSQAVGGAAEAFHSLLRILGPEAAIESVIRAVSLSQDT
uniref:Centromere protein P n=1 Tax=Seriola lalandi dorsalis TaxID=1841481 RepID=A0A3B4WUQ0_SERLL